MLGDAFAAASDFDVIHAHVDWLAYPFTRLTRTPTVHTLHGRLDEPRLPAIYARYPELNLVSISDAQRAPLPETSFIATVHHGMPQDLLRADLDGGDAFVFLGRISIEKGPVLAIQAARAAGVRLVLAAKVDPVDLKYFEREVRPLIDDDQIRFIGEVSDREKQAVLGGARALIAPIDWPEPFGLVFIEALACGTPVITRPCGSAPEIVEHGHTGMIASTLEEIVSAMKSIDRIDRRTCRARFEERFGVERMGDDYERVYRHVIGTRRFPQAIPELQRDARSQ
jgi:glycosyltransferase involved in cell wall biosynthesis